MAHPSLQFDYYIRLSHNNGAEEFYFPVLPESIEIKKKGKGQSYNIVGLGEINVIHSRELAEISFESFFPVDRNAPYLSINNALYRTPKDCINKISKWQGAKYPSRITIKAPNMSLSIACSIEQFDRREDAGSGDIYFRLTLKEYRFYSPRKVIMAKDENGKTVLQKQPPKRLDERVPPTSYTLKPGEDLGKVARMQLNDETRWREIQKLNNLTDADLKKLKPGLVLKLPERR
ncbi:MAG: LysM peptidoglycan-binding domain-containing protein [Paenibacillus dendritiformis]|uniref:LysM peptidoglycan-binding domain-containing protein n=1 Tax=uncultured Paenibacillus sp. TaxID=227322 RepID=UPI0026005E75|nr:LysM peptidoglycan-binding domain-containing protein [uncultured Paenibacillus sp.]MDU5141058.1 LysM peptidoglycan-binding domain-containing protein [Paenibacillus dendritiformis]